MSDDVEIGRGVSIQLEGGGDSREMTIVDHDERTVTFQLDGHRIQWVRGSGPLINVYRALMQMESPSATGARPR